MVFYLPIAGLEVGILDQIVRQVGHQHLGLEPSLTGKGKDVVRQPLPFLKSLALQNLQFSYLFTGNIISYQKLVFYASAA